MPHARGHIHDLDHSFVKSKNAHCDVSDGSGLNDSNVLSDVTVHFWQSSCSDGEGPLVDEYIRIRLGRQPGTALIVVVVVGSLAYLDS